MIFLNKKYLFWIFNRNYSDRISELDISDGTIKFKIYLSVESYAKKYIISKLSKISIPNLNSINWRLGWRLCQYIYSGLYLSYFPRNKPPKTIPQVIPENTSIRYRMRPRLQKLQRSDVQLSERLACLGIMGAQLRPHTLIHIKHHSTVWYWGV